MIAHRRDPENDPIPVRPNPDASFNPRRLRRTPNHENPPPSPNPRDSPPILQIDHLTLHQDKDNNQIALAALNLEKVAHTTQHK